MRKVERGVTIVEVEGGFPMTVYKLRKMSLEAIKRYGLEKYVRVSDKDDA